MPSGFDDKRFMLSVENQNATDGWVLCFPRGDYYFDKYRKTIKFDDSFFDKIASAFKSEKLSKPFVDVDHDFGRSMGDIVDYKIDERGMSFKLALTDEGEELLKKGHYKYISPSWGGVKDTDGNGYTKLLTISFTNLPAFEGNLPTLQSQLFAASNSADFELILVEKKQRGDVHMYELTKHLGLSNEASEDAIYSAVMELSKKVEAAESEVKTLTAKVAEKESELKSAQDKAIELGNELNAITLSKLESEADVFLKENIELGKIHPATQEIWKARYIKDAQAAKDEMSLIPAKDGAQLSNSGAGVTGASEEEIMAMTKAQLDPKDPEDVKIYRARKRELGGK